MTQQLQASPQTQTTVQELPSLLEQIVAQGLLRPSERHGAVEVILPDSGTEALGCVQVQLIEWDLVESPCPGCGHFPCLPGIQNGHRLHAVCKAGPVIEVYV